VNFYGGIEAGGTNFVCAVGIGPDDLKDEIRYSTTTPEETIGEAIQFFQGRKEILQAIGIGSFGPVDLNPKSQNMILLHQHQNLDRLT
jgi:fructokinase